MKKVIACLLTTSLVSILTSSSALAVGPLVGARVICAPEVVEGNLSATNRILSGLADTDLKDSGQFRNIVNVALSKSPEEQIQLYMDLLGISGDQEITEFIGARNINPKHISALSHNAQISKQQAEIVVSKLQESLKGQIK